MADLRGLAGKRRLDQVRRGADDVQAERRFGIGGCAPGQCAGLVVNGDGGKLEASASRAVRMRSPQIKEGAREKDEESS